MTLAIAVLALVGTTFAATTTLSGKDEVKPMMGSGIQIGSGMRQERNDMRAQVSTNRGQMKENASSTREEFKELKFLRTDLSEADKTALKTARKTSQDALKALHDEYTTKIKANPNQTATLTADLNSKILVIRQAELATIKLYVASDKTEEFTEFSTNFLTNVEENGQLRAENIQARMNFRSDLYSAKTTTTINAIEQKLTKPLSTMGEAKKTTLLNTLILKLDQKIAEYEKNGTDTELFVALKSKIQDLLGIEPQVLNTTSN